MSEAAVWRHLRCSLLAARGSQWRAHPRSSSALGPLPQPQTAPWQLQWHASSLYRHSTHRFGCWSPWSGRKQRLLPKLCFATDRLLSLLGLKGQPRAVD